MLCAANKTEAQPTATLTLAWNAPSQTNVAGFRLYYKRRGALRSRLLLLPSSAREWQLPGLRWGQTYSFFVTALSAEGIESKPSNRAIYTLPPTNRPPTISRITNQVTISGSTVRAPFKIADPETPAPYLRLRARSSDPSLVPLDHIVFLGTNYGRAALITPASDKAGTVRIWIDVTDSFGAVASTSFVVSVQPRNQPPTLDLIRDLAILEDSGPQTIVLTGISPGDSNGSQTLSVFAESSNPEVLPKPTVSYSSPDQIAFVSIAPLANRSGQSSVTVFVDDGQSNNHLFSRSFLVTVTPQNDPPTISDISAQRIAPGASLNIPFRVGDQESPPEDLIASAVSSNTALISNDALTISGTGTARSLSVQSAPNQAGSTVVTVSASDPSGASASASFLIDVIP